MHRLPIRAALCCHSNETRAPIANSPNSAQLGGIPYHCPKLHPGPCSSVGMRQRTDRQIDRQTRLTIIDFASSTTHAKCNETESTSGDPTSLWKVVESKYSCDTSTYVRLRTTSSCCYSAAQITGTAKNWGRVPPRIWNGGR